MRKEKKEKLKIQQDWQHVFRRFDKDSSGSIDAFELQSALNQFGYKLPRHLLALLVAKYCTSALQAVSGGFPLTRLCALTFVNFFFLFFFAASSPMGSEVPGQQTITFDRFIRACVFVRQFTESFVRLDGDKDGWVRLNYEQFLSVYFTLP